MPEPELSLVFVRPLNRLGIRYIVSGGVASILYGEPRLTNDVDFVVFLKEAEIARPSKGRFNLIHADSSFKADFYMAGRDDLNAWAFRNSRKLEYRIKP